MHSDILMDKIARRFAVPAWTPQQIADAKDAVADLPLEPLGYAVQELLSTRVERPGNVVAWLRRHVAEQRAAAELPSLAEAWRQVTTLHKRDWSPLVRRVWDDYAGPQFVETMLENQGTTYAQFRDLYNAAREREVVDHAKAHGAYRGTLVQRTVERVIADTPRVLEHRGEAKLPWVGERIRETIARLSGGRSGHGRTTAGR